MGNNNRYSFITILFVFALLFLLLLALFGIVHVNDLPRKTIMIDVENRVVCDWFVNGTAADLIGNCVPLTNSFLMSHGIG